MLELIEQQRKIEKLTVEVDELEQDNVGLHETVEEIMTASNNEIVTFQLMHNLVKSYHLKGEIISQFKLMVQLSLDSIFARC